MQCHDITYYYYTYNTQVDRNKGSLTRETIFFMIIGGENSHYLYPFYLWMSVTTEWALLSCPLPWSLSVPASVMWRGVSTESGHAAQVEIAGHLADRWWWVTALAHTHTHRPDTRWPLNHSIYMVICPAP